MLKITVSVEGSARLQDHFRHEAGTLEPVTLSVEVNNGTAGLDLAQKFLERSLGARMPEATELEERIVGLENELNEEQRLVKARGDQAVEVKQFRDQWRNRCVALAELLEELERRHPGRRPRGWRARRADALEWRR